MTNTERSPQTLPQSQKPSRKRSGKGRKQGEREEGTRSSTTQERRRRERNRELEEERRGGERRRSGRGIKVVEVETDWVMVRSRARQRSQQEGDESARSGGREFKGIQIVVKVNNSKTCMVDATPSDKVQIVRRTK